MPTTKRLSGTDAPASEKPHAAQTKHRAPSIGVIGTAVAVAAVVVAAVAFMWRDKIYDPASSYGTESPHIAVPAQSEPPKR